MRALLSFVEIHIDSRKIEKIGTKLNIYFHWEFTNFVTVSWNWCFSSKIKNSLNFSYVKIRNFLLKIRIYENLDISHEIPKFFNENKNLFITQILAELLKMIKRSVNF